MSGLAAYVRWSGASPARDEASRLLDRTPWRGSERRRWADARTSLAVAAWPTRGALAGQIAGDVGVVVAFDGRLDGCGGLPRALGLPRDAPDADVVRAAYLSRGIAFAADLAGDFALVVWDAREGRVVAARDITGTRPLVYGADAEAFVCASDVAAVLGARSRAINEGMVAEYLAERITSRTDTFYDGVYRLAPGHVLVADAHGCRTSRYWTPDPSLRRGVSLDDWAAEWREALDGAVATRLRDAETAFVALSGGLDSSAILAAGTRLARHGAVRTRLAAYTIARPGQPGDETEAARRVAGELGVPWTPAPVVPVDEVDLVATVRATAEPPDLPIALAAWPMLAAARARAHGLALTGFGGDDWFFGTAAHTADLLASGRAVAAARWLVAEHRGAIGVRDWPRIAWFLVPARHKPPARRLLGRRAAPSHLDPAFARRVGFEARIRSERGVPSFETRVQAAVFAKALSGDPVFHNELQERAFARAGLDEVRPFHDRRLVRLALAMPEDVRRPGARPKGLMQHALRDRLSADVLAYRHDVDGSPVFVDTLRRLCVDARLDSLEPVRRGWVRPDALRALWRAGAAGHGASTLKVWMTVAIDLWLREIGA